MLFTVGGGCGGELRGDGIRHGDCSVGRDRVERVAVGRERDLDGLAAVEDGERPSALDGYSGDFNLAFAPDFADQTRTYRPVSIRGDNDVNDDALFIDAPRQNYHLADGSPAIDTGTSVVGDLLIELLQGTTSPDGELDVPPIDMGYHYPAPPEAQ